FNNGGRVPLRKKNLVALQFEPSLQQVHLRRFSGAVKTLYRDQPSRRGILFCFSHQFARSSTTTLASKTLSNKSRLAARAHFSSSMSPLPFMRNRNRGRLYSTVTLSTLDACS